MIDTRRYWYGLISFSSIFNSAIALAQISKVGVDKYPYDEYSFGFDEIFVGLLVFGFVVTLVGVTSNRLRAHRHQQVVKGVENPENAVRKIHNAWNLNLRYSLCLVLVGLVFTYLRPATAALTLIWLIYLFFFLFPVIIIYWIVRKDWLSLERTAVVVFLSLYLLRGFVSLVFKPVIYLYPPINTEVTVKLDLVGLITKSEPLYKDDGWKVIATPDGSLLDLKSNSSTPYLFWEAAMPFKGDRNPPSGFVVPQSNLASFFNQKLPELGLNASEIKDFNEYWLPKLSAYNTLLIYFAGDEYYSLARLKVTPAPDTEIRVFMVVREVEPSFIIQPQQFQPRQRAGFTLVEWGGTIIE